MFLLFYYFFASLVSFSIAATMRPARRGASIPIRVVTIVAVLPFFTNTISAGRSAARRILKAIPWGPVIKQLTIIDHAVAALRAPGVGSLQPDLSTSIAR